MDDGDPEAGLHELNPNERPPLLPLLIVVTFIALAIIGLVAVVRWIVP